MQAGSKVRAIKDLGESHEDEFIVAGTEGVVESIADDGGPFPVTVVFGDLVWFVWADELQVVDSSESA